MNIYEKGHTVTLCWDDHIKKFDIKIVEVVELEPPAHQKDTTIRKLCYVDNIHYFTVYIDAFDNSITYSKIFLDMSKYIYLKNLTTDLYKYLVID